MITEYQKFQLPDIRKKNSLKAEVNWSEDPKLNESKVIKFTTPDGSSLLVERKHLNEILFAIGRPEDQQKMIPQKLTKVHHRETTLGIKATKRIEKGEMINFPIKFDIPCDNIQEIVGQAAWTKGMKDEMEKEKSGIIIPKKHN